MNHEFISPPKTLTLPLTSEGTFDFFPTWKKLAGVDSLQHLPPVPYESPARKELAALLEIQRPERVETVTSPDHWERKRSLLRSNLDWLLGERPDGRREVTAKTIFETACSGYVRRKIRLQIERQVSSKVVFQSNDNGATRRRVLVATESETIPGYLCIPSAIRSPRPAVICLHNFNVDQGARESVGLDDDHQDLAFADHLARSGFVTLSFDLPGQGERKSKDRNSAEQTIEFYRSSPMRSLLGRMIWEVSCAVDYLSTLESVAPRRVGCMGHLLGGIVSLFASALDERIAAVVASSACSTFSDQFESGRGEQIWYAGTGLLPVLGFFDRERIREIPIEYHEILAQIAPRPLFLSTPLRSDYFPREGTEEVARHLENLYAFLGSPHHLSVNFPHYFVYFSEELRENILQWLQRFL